MGSSSQEDGEGCPDDSSVVPEHPNPLWEAEEQALWNWPCRPDREGPLDPGFLQIPEGAHRRGQEKGGAKCKFK